MGFRSGRKIPIPPVDITTFLLDPERDSNGDIVPPCTKPVFLSAENPERVNYTFTEFRDLTMAFASGLRKKGFKKGDRVQVCAPASIYIYVILFGTIAAGGVFNGSPKEYTVREVRAHLKHFKPSVCIVGRECLGVAEEALTDDEVKIFVFNEDLTSADKRERYEHWSSLIDREGGETYEWERLTAEECKTTTALVNYTSGTTGDPKGVQSTHLNLVSLFATLATLEGVATAKHRDGCWQKEATGKVPKKVIVLPWHGARPMAQAQAARIKLAGVGIESQVYIMGRGYVGPENLLDYLAEYSATYIPATPNVWNDILDFGKTSSKSWNLTSLTNVTSASGPLLPHISSAVETFLKSQGAFNDLRIVSNYASTETGFMASAPPGCLDYSTAAVGFIAPNLDVKLIDLYDSTKVISQENAPGVIHVRGPSVSPGYYRNPETTAGVFLEDGWFCTGDVGYFDAGDGMLYVVDRVKDVIKAPAGMSIHPIDIESLLMKISGIKECGVVGVREARTGYEIVTAFVVKDASDTNLSEDTIKNMVNKDLAAFKHIQRVIILDDPLPREKQLGKLLRRELRQMAQRPSG